MKNILISFVILLFTTLGFAHSGRTDSSGCHHDRIHGGYHCHKSEPEPRAISSTEDYEVSYNQKSQIYHRTGCKSAKSCTVNCIPMKKSEAIERGGRPCGNCGG